MIICVIVNVFFAIVVLGMLVTVMGRIPIGLVLSIINKRKLHDLAQYYSKAEDSLFDISYELSRKKEKLEKKSDFSYSDYVEATRLNRAIFFFALRSFVAALAAMQYKFVMAIMPNVSLFGKKGQAL